MPVWRKTRSPAVHQAVRSRGAEAAPSSRKGVHSGVPAGMPIFLGGAPRIQSSTQRLVSAARSDEGQPLDAGLRAEFAPAFGDLTDVRVHTGARAAEASHALDASAFTVGRDLFFDVGAYRPETTAGRQLIAHEAAHAVQQRQASSDTPIGLAPDERAEKDAHTASVLRARPQVQVTSPQVMRHPKTANQIYEEFVAEGDWNDRDEKGLGERLLNLALESPDNLALVGEVFEKLSNLNRGARVGVAAAFMEAAGPLVLDRFARTERGRVLVVRLRESFLRPGLFTFDEVALKLAAEDVLGRAEGRNRAEATLDTAVRRSQSAPPLLVESIGRKGAEERLRLVRQMLSQIRMLYPKDSGIAVALTTLKSELDARFGDLLFSFPESDAKQMAVTQLIVERCYRSLRQFDSILPNLTDQTGKDPSQQHRLEIAGRVRKDWVEALKHAVSPEGPRLLATAEAESAALPGALYDLYLGSVSTHGAHFTDMTDGVEDMLAWVSWVRARREALDVEFEALEAARLKGAPGLEERTAKAAKEAELIALSIEGIQLWEQGVRAHETLFVEIHPLLNWVPHVPLNYRDAANIRARGQTMKSAALSQNLETLRTLAEKNRNDPTIQQFLRGIPLFVFGAKIFPSLLGNLLISYSILRLSMAASTAVGQLVPAVEGGSLRALAAQVGLESLTFTGVSRTLQAAVGSPSKTPFLLDLVLNAGLFGVLRVAAPAIHNAFASRGMELAAWAAPHAGTLALLQGFGVLHFRIEEGRWPSAAEIGQMAPENLIMYAVMVRAHSAAPARRAPTSRLAILENLHSKYGDRLGAFEEARTKLANRISVEVRAGRADDQKVQAKLTDESTALNENLRKLVDDIKNDPEINLKKLADALKDPALSGEKVSSELLTRSLDLPAQTAVRRAGGEAEFTYEHGTTEALIDGLEAKGIVFREVDAKGRNMVTAEPEGQAPMFFLERPPAGAFESGKAPRGAGEITQFLRGAGLSEAEIIGFGSANAQKLTARTAGRVAKLAEHFTASDLKALGDFLFRYEIDIDNAMVDALIDRVSPGDMADAVANLEARARQVQEGSGTAFDMAESLGISPGGGGGRPRAAKAPKAGPQFDPPFRLAEIQAGPALEAKFPATDWTPAKKTRAPGGKTDLGSTIPDWSSVSNNMAVEVKRFNIEELGIGKAGERIDTPSERSEEALRRARTQLAGRRWVLKKGTKQVLIMNVTGQATDLAAVGRRLAELLADKLIKYDQAFVQDKLELTEIK